MFLFCLLAIAMVTYCLIYKPSFVQFASVSIMLALCTIGVAYANEVVAESTAIVASVPVEAAPPAWLSDFVVWVYSIPKVGPIVAEIGKWLGVLATLFTTLSIAVTAVLKILEVATAKAGFKNAAEKVAKFNDAVQPYIKWLSILNPKKK